MVPSRLVPDETLPESERVDARNAERAARAGRGYVGAAAFAARFVEKRTSAEVSARQERLLAFGDRSQKEIRALDDHFRRIRYPSAPWDGDPESMLPVSWFLLWRSNVSEEIRPAMLLREKLGRGAVDTREGLPERVGFERPDPSTFTTRAPARIRPRDASSLRSRPTTEE